MNPIKKRLAITAETVRVLGVHELIAVNRGALELRRDVRWQRPVPLRYRERRLLMRHVTKRLALNAETIRALTDAQLRGAVGGAAPQSTDEMTICPAGPSVAPVRCQSINWCDLTNTCNAWCLPR